MQSYKPDFLRNWKCSPQLSLIFEVRRITSRILREHLAERGGKTKKENGSLESKTLLFVVCSRKRNTSTLHGFPHTCRSTAHCAPHRAMAVEDHIQHAEPQQPGEGVSPGLDTGQNGGVNSNICSNCNLAKQIILKEKRQTRRRRRLAKLWLILSKHLVVLYFSCVCQKHKQNCLGRFHMQLFWSPPPRPGGGVA